MSLSLRAWGALFALGLPLVGCSPPTPPPPPPDLTTPAGPVRALLDAARAGDPSFLGGLCDPEGQLDSDARRVCRGGPERPDELEMIIDWFDEAAILGSPRVEGERAEVSLRFGPRGDRETSVVVVRREGKWYLSAL